MQVVYLPKRPAWGVDPRRVVVDGRLTNLGGAPRMVPMTADFLNGLGAESSASDQMNSTLKKLFIFGGVALALAVIFMPHVKDADDDQRAAE